MMRHSIAVKFIALCLAALSLLAVLGSAGGILGLACLDLYEDSFDEYYSSVTHNTRQDFAVNLVHRYASLALGKLPEQYLNDYYGGNWMYNTFQYGTFFYTIRNEQGRVVESTMAEAPAGGQRHELVVTNLRYRVLVHTLVETDTGLVPNVPPVTTPDTQNTIPPQASEPTEVTEPATPIMRASETYEGVSQAQAAKEAELNYDSYYDNELGRMVGFAFTYQNLPPYTVELYLLPGAVAEEYAWTLLRQVWNFRNELFWVLGIGALSFAVFMVLLCLCAGWKKGGEEPRAGGLNCIPLDLYLVGVGFAGAFTVAVGYEVMGYLIRYSPRITLPVAALWGYVMCLLVVAFFFACAAQFKTKGGYWWRNTLCGWFFRLCYGLSNWLARFLGPLLGQLFGKVWQLLRLAVRLLVKLWLWLCTTVEKLLGWFYRLVGTMLRKLAAGIGRFFGLLPLMWQWLIVGAAMLLTVTFALVTRSEGMLVLSLCGGFALILYGASSFGTLLDAAKRMGKGNLETKVNDKHLIGSFKEFAGDLNALADVAVVAARNQLKSERMKTELITNVSHDIKTPLTSIINYVDLLQKPHTEEEQAAYLEVLSRQSGQLKKLIEDLMEMSRASTGNMAVDITAVDAVEAVNQALGEFADKFQKIQLTPVFRQPEEPIYMKADGRLAWRVLSNLLSNAYKYALPGTRLYIDLMELEGKVLISLKNISREALNVSAEELLERFVRGDASRNTEGSGLGLNIAQSRMELQKGQLQLLVDGDLFKVTLVFPGARME